jgi:GNAT superfamily N-acetyltransferase
VERPLELRAIESGEITVLQELIEADPGYTERVTGHPPGASDALSLLLARPEGLGLDDKVVLGAWSGAHLVGVVDLLRGHPDESRAFLGLLQVRWELQRDGIWRRLSELTESWVRDSWPEIERLRVAVVDTNAVVAAPFWAAMAFVPTGEDKPYRYDKLESTTRLYEKAL